ncbi:MAG TPA: dienelactone hydrolase family protein [Phototrophicaceae bacterium]|jgi:predicted esterase|nr:dienelactone hydrolase family protein [Phototrophicaceae bacterium]
MTVVDLHRTQPVSTAGAKPEHARAAMILLHGRSASAGDILTLAEEFDGSKIAFFAPQAANGTWYPQRFIAPVEQNEPWLTWSLAKVNSVVEAVKAAGIPSEKIILAGFSQGACLALEYAARHPQRYGGVIGFSGGLIGEAGVPLRYAENADLAGTPVFLGCSDVDFHIPKTRVEESADALKQMNGDVTVRLYRGMGHTINEDELMFARQMTNRLVNQK